MIRKTALFLLLLTTPVVAQDDSDDIQPFTGIITGERVNVRSGASLNYYRVATLEEGDLVEVRSMLYQWYEIEPTNGVYSLISKRYVRPDDDGKGGRVTADRVNVRAPSPKGPENSYKIQTTLNTDDAIEIVGEEDDWYRIAPPDEATLWVHSDYIRTATEQEIRAAERGDGEAGSADAADSEPDTTTDTSAAADASEDASEDDAQADDATDAADTVAMDDTDTADAADDADGETASEDGDAETEDGGSGETATTTDSEATDSDTTTDTEEAIATEQTTEAAGTEADDSTTVAEGDDAEAADSEDADEAGADNGESRDLDRQLTALERRFAEVSGRPLAEQRGLEQLRAEYQQLAESEDLAEEQRVVVDTRLELLAGRIDLQQAMADLERQKRDLDERRAARPMSYDAVGRLAASSIYDGKELPRLYRLVDPMSGLTVGYVKPTDAVDLVGALGRTVGVVGDSRYDPTLRLNVIKPEKLFIVSGEE